MTDKDGIYSEEAQKLLAEIRDKLDEVNPLIRKLYHLYESYITCVVGTYLNAMSK